MCFWPPSARTRPTWQSPLSLGRPVSTRTLPPAAWPWNHKCLPGSTMYSAATTSTLWLACATESKSTRILSSSSAQSPTAWSVRARDAWSAMNWKITSLTLPQAVAICVNLIIVLAVPVWRGARSVMKQMAIQSGKGRDCANGAESTTAWAVRIQVAPAVMRPMDTYWPRLACAGCAGSKTVSVVLTPHALAVMKTMDISSIAPPTNASCVPWQIAWSARVWRSARCATKRRITLWARRDCARNAGWKGAWTAAV